MSFAAILLVIAAATLLASLAAPRESWLLAAIAVYTGVLLWLIRNDLDLLLPGLAIALVFGVLAVWRLLRRTLRVEDAANDSPRHNSSKAVTTNTSMIGGGLG